jgi:hypothetical protein
MTDDHLPPESELARAFRGVRDAYDGTNDESNLTLQRALLRTRGDRRRRLTRWAVLPIAAVLVASTAWAGVTGRLAPAVHAMLDTLRDDGHDTSTATSSPSPSPSLSPSPPPSLSPPPPPSLSPPPPPSPAPEPEATAEPPPVLAPPPASIPRAPSTASAPIAALAPPPPAPSPPPAPEPPPAPSAAADPQAALFAEAHRLHFTDRDPARALVAWDRYLAATPYGRLAPEARYNRALTLIRLGRRAEAQQELTAFASGLYGDYRRSEAKALLEAFARDAAPSP